MCAALVSICQCACASHVRKNARRWCTGVFVKRREGRSGHAHFGFASFHMANHAGIGKAVLLEGTQHFVHSVWRAGHQQAAGGLGVGQQGALGIGDVFGQADGFAVGRPVTARSTGEDALLGQLHHAGQDGQGIQVNVGCQLGAACQFQTVAQQAKAGHVRQGMHAVEF